MRAKDENLDELDELICGLISKKMTRFKSNRKHVGRIRIQ